MTPKILLVDDDKNVSFAIAETLRFEGYEVMTAESGNQAIALLKEQTPDLIITDIVMPDGDGFEFIRHLKSECPDIPVISISGGFRINSGEVDTYLKMTELMGAKVTLRKPFDDQQLLSEVSRLLSE